MNRYQIAILKNNLEHRVLFTFPDTRSVKKVIKYILYSIEKKGVFSTENLSPGVVCSALIHVSKEYKSPILVKTKAEANALSIAHSHKNVYSLDNLDNLPDARVICYDIDPPSQVRDILVILSSRKT